ncbi:MAG: hypothetical protein RMK01_05525 [Thermomicrobium sp.]|nr:hypothetical protein [Thermomicrobium sp.]MDW8059515.1 hypothetical protein [Thermomicrobium sp.]
MRRGTVRSFLGGFVLGALIGALTAWSTRTQRPPIPPVVRERAGALFAQACAQSRELAATLRTRLATVRGTVETRIAGPEKAASGEATGETQAAEVAVEAER